MQGRRQKTRAFRTLRLLINTKPASFSQLEHTIRLIMRALSIIYSAVLFGCLLPSNAVDPLVDVGFTKYLGTALPNKVTQWLGMRFAAPPVGNLRFRAPADPPVNKSIQLADQVLS